MLYEIYLVVNKLNAKKYVGQVNKKTGYINRFKHHIWDAYNRKNDTSIFHAAIRKYGKDAFDLKLVETDISEKDIDKKEIYYIGLFNSYCINGQGYNMTLGGQGVHGYHHSKDSLQRISEGVKKSWEELKTCHPLEYDELRKERSLRLKGKPKSTQQKEKLSAIAKNRFKTSPGTFKGKHHSEETKKHLSEIKGCKVAMIDIKTREVLKIFHSAIEATQYLISKKLTTNKYANARILEICAGHGKSAYGYIWKKI